MAGLGSWGAWEDGQASKAKADLESLKASYAIAAASAITHAQAVTAADTKNLQNQGRTAIASAATKNTAVQIHYKTVYLPSLTKLDPKDEANKCAGLPVPTAVLTSLPNGPGS